MNKSLKKIELIFVLFLISNITIYGQNNNLEGTWMFPENGKWSEKTITNCGNTCYKIPLPGNRPISFNHAKDNYYKSSVFNYYMRVIDNNHIQIIFSRDNSMNIIRKSIEFYFETGDYTTAVNKMQIEVNKDKKNITLKNSLAWYQIFNKEFSEANKTILDAIEIEKKHPDNETKKYLLGNLAHTYLLMGNYDKAMSIYKENAHLKLGNMEWNIMVLYDLMTFKEKSIEHKDLNKAILETIERINLKLDKTNIGYFFDVRDDKLYRITKIGNQIWFAQNLRYKHKNSLTVGEEYEKQQGRYYTYNDALVSCPEGWHLPTDNDWKILEKHLGMAENELDNLGFKKRGEVIGVGYKLTTDKDLGFYARYTGYASQRTKQFKAINENGNYWTASKTNEVNAIMRVFGTKFKSVIRDETSIGNYLTCRCVKNDKISDIVKTNPDLDRLTKQIKAQPSQAENYYLRSIEFHKIGEYKLALEDINKAVSMSKENANYHLFKAEVLYTYNYLSNKLEIIKLIDKYLEKDKNNAFAWYFKSKTTVYEPTNSELIFTKDATKLTKALTTIKKAITLDPKNPYFTELATKIYFAQNDNGNTIKSLEKEIKFDNTNADAYALLALTKIKDYDRINRKNNLKIADWCIFTGQCYKLTAKNITEICGYLKNAKKYGSKHDLTPYNTLCSDLRAAELYQQHKPKTYIGPRGGVYQINSHGTKIYLPKK